MDTLQIKNLTSRLTAIGFVVGVAIIWQTATSMFNIPEFIVPSPSRIGTEIIREFGLLFRHTSITILEAFLGFCLANIIAFSVAISFVRLPFVEKSFFPSFVAIQSIPIVAFAPLIGLWFGEGLFGKVIMAAFITFFPMVVNATTGLKSADRQAVELMHTLSATNRQILFRLRIPAARPYIMSALRISAPLAVVGAIVAELSSASSGIGYLILVSAYRVETAKLFACLVFAASAGIFFFFLALLAEKITAPKSRAGQIDAARIWRYIRNKRRIPDDLARRLNHSSSLEFKRQARPNDVNYIVHLIDSELPNVRFLGYSLLHNFARQSEGFCENDNKKAISILQEAWQRAQHLPSANEQFDEKMTILWPMLDGLEPNNSMHYEIYQFIRENWKQWRNRTLQYYAEKEGSRLLDATKEKLADPGCPESKKWVYLLHIALAAEGHEKNVREFVIALLAKTQNCKREIHELFIGLAEYITASKTKLGITFIPPNLTQNPRKGA